MVSTSFLVLNGLAVLTAWVSVYLIDRAHQERMEKLLKM